MKLHDELILSFGGEVIIDGKEYAAQIGKHEIWVPELELKVVWSYHGGIESIRDWDKGRNRFRLIYGTFNSEAKGFSPEAKRSLANEYGLFKLLSDRKLSPPIGETVYFKNVISEYLYGIPQCDCTGMYGFHMADATRLPKGEYSSETFWSQMGDFITASALAKGDLLKPNNTVNGYLVDVRRTLWDMIQLRNSENMLFDLWSKNFEYREDEDKLKEKLLSLSQFPHRQRKLNYQTYSLGNRYEEGSRDTMYRMKMMGMPTAMDKFKVLDLGCNLGAFCIEAISRGAVKVLGVDNEQDYIRCARDLARWNGCHVNYMVFDLSKNIEAFVAYVKAYFANEKIDIVLGLSLYKHIGDKLFDILRTLSWKTCYLESHNAPEGHKTPHVLEMASKMDRIGSRIEYLGTTTDRSPRMVWRLER